MTSQASHVKCFPLSQKQLLTSGPCLKPSPTSPVFFLSVSSVSLLPQVPLFSTQCLPLRGGCDTALCWQRGGYWAATTRLSQDPPPLGTHPNLSEWFIGWKKGERGVSCAWLHHNCVRASPVAAVFLTLTHKRNGLMRGRGHCLCCS